MDFTAPHAIRRREHLFELPIQGDPLVFTRAAQIAVETGQHLFDTLYHAVALAAESATLITADDRYLTKAASRGRIVALGELAGWSMYEPMENNYGRNDLESSSRCTHALPVGGRAITATMRSC